MDRFLAALSAPGRDWFRCSVCSAVFTDPATLACGHTFCSGCISAHWDREKDRGYTCPKCPHKFCSRPVLIQNSPLEQILKDVVNRVGPFEFPGPGEVACDVCPRLKRKAVMTCLGCRVSYCERHRSGHMVEHWTVEPGIDLKKNVCHVHHRTVSLYCNTDRQLVCPVCAEKLHTGHQIISAEEEMVRRKAVMVAEQQNVETLLQKHKRTRGKIQQKIKKMITDSTVDFSNRAPEYFILCRALLNNAGVALTWFLQQVQVNNKRKAQLEQEVGDVTERLSELDSLSQIKDLVRFKKVYKAFCQEKPKTYPEIPTLYTVKELTDLMRDVSEKLSKTKNLPLSISLSPVLYYQPITREQFMRCYVDIQLDPDTAHPCLLLSEDGRKVTVVKKPQKYPDHPKRFSHARQALAKLLLLHSYFEAVWEKEPKILGFADQRIHRKGEGQECVLGMNSWSCFLRMDSSKTTLWHNKEEVTIETSHKVNRVGVFVDTLAASMSFYDVDDGMRLLAMIQTNFAEVFVAVGFPDETPNSVEFVKPN